MSWLIRIISYETSVTMRGATGITLQPHQILRLPRKRNHSIVTAHIWNIIYNARSDRNLPPTSPNTAPATQKECHDWSAHIWNVIYNARSDRNLPPTSPNTAPATQKECHDWSASHMKRHLQCAERQASPSPNTAPATQNYTPKS